MKHKNNDNSFIGESKREEHKDFEDLFKGVEAFMGYLPNAHLAMAERPELLMAFSGLASTVFQADGIDIQTKQLIALASSLSSGCKYCQAHTSHGAERAGVENEKIVDILNYVESTKYSDKKKLYLIYHSLREKHQTKAHKSILITLESTFLKKK